MSDTTNPIRLPEVETLTKLLAIFAGFLYLCGFLVVSIHLSQYGIYSVSLLRTQYISAGVLAIGPLCLTYFVAAAIYLFFGGNRLGPYPEAIRGRLWWLASMIWELVKLLVVTSAVIDAFASILVPSAHDLLWHQWRVLLWLTVQTIGFAVTLSGTWTAVRYLQLVQLDFKKTFAAVLPATACIFFFFAYINYFTNRIYAEIPFAVGGGKPISVVFLLKPVPSPTMSPIVSDNSGARSIPYQLLLETETSYAVLSPVSKERVIEFNRDAVMGYVVLEDR